MSNRLSEGIGPSAGSFEIFLVATPGLEAIVCDEAVAQGFSGAKPVQGGVAFTGSWPDVWRANLLLRCPTRVLARIASFHVGHLAQLDKKSRAVQWASLLPEGTPFRVEATCRKSKIYHSGAAAERVSKAIAEAIRSAPDPGATVTIMARIEQDLCTLSLDTSAESLHKRGHKVAVARAPLRETLAAALLRACDYAGQEPVLDPMCGSGTFVIEAAEIAMGLAPGRRRSFAFERVQSFDAQAWEALRASYPRRATECRFFGADRDAGAIAASQGNAQRAGVAAFTQFIQRPISDLQRPHGPTGLVIINPPYGARIGNTKLLQNLHATLGRVLRERFAGWRVGLITPDERLAKATGLPFKPPGAWINHGGLRIRLFQTLPL